MPETSIPATSTEQRPLAGRACWVITDGKVGMDVQVLGLANALGVAITVKHVVPTGLTRKLAPYGPLGSSDRFGKPGAQFSPPWPDLAIATGRLSIPYLRAIGRAAGRACFRVVLQDPKTPAQIADMIWVPAHDRRRGQNVFTTLTPPHDFTPARLADLRANPRADLAALPSPRVAVILGGSNAVYPFTQKDGVALAAGLAELAASAGSFMVTPSRRSPPWLVAAVSAAIGDRPAVIWNGAGANPYPHMLALADALVVTGDSVNMVGEACATGRPVYVFEPEGGSAKFRRFHDALRSYGATRPFTSAVNAQTSWHYEPLQSTDLIAREVERCWLSQTSRADKS